MAKKKICVQPLLQDVQMDASVNFMAEGNINIFPCPWESEKEVTNKGKRVRYRAGVEVDADGRARVKRYLDGTKGSQHETLFETAHGVVKMTRPWYRSDNGSRRLSEESVYITFRFPKKYGGALIKALYKEETEEIMSYLKTRKEETVWA
ncbi:MAG: hypothetical protein J1E58_10770 [Prevotella sp.]|nr:hypothetical protein [Prevotella sp.]